MTRSLPIAALAALLSALPAAGAPAAPAAALSARALVDSVAAHYSHLAAYRFGGVSVSNVTGDSVPIPMHNEVPFLFAAIRPGKLRNEIDHPTMGARIVSDGDSLTVLSTSRNQYTVQPAPMLVPGTGVSDPFTNQLQPLLSLTTLATDLIAAEDLGRDTVRTLAGPVPCRRLLLHYRPDTTHAETSPQTHVLWIDEKRRLVLRDSTTFRIDHSAYGPVRNEMMMRFSLVDDASGGPDTLYHVRFPEGASRIVPQTPRMPAPPALQGKDASDFTLSGLDGRKVTLSTLRGSVVVLDFWATWCNPCRRWLPIVARLEQEMKARGVKFFAVNVGETPEKVRQYLRAVGLSLPVLLDREGEVGDAYGARSIPLTVVVGKDGKVSGALLGLHPESDLRAALAAAGVKAP